MWLVDRSRTLTRRALLARLPRSVDSVEAEQPLVPVERLGLQLVAARPLEVHLVLATALVHCSIPVWSQAFRQLLIGA